MLIFITLALGALAIIVTGAIITAISIGSFSIVEIPEEQLTPEQKALADRVNKLSNLELQAAIAEELGEGPQTLNQLADEIAAARQELKQAEDELLRAKTLEATPAQESAPNNRPAAGPLAAE